MRDQGEHSLCDVVVDVSEAAHHWSNLRIMSYGGLNETAALPILAATVLFLLGKTHTDAAVKAYTASIAA